MKIKIFYTGRTTFPFCFLDLIHEKAHAVEVQIKSQIFPRRLSGCEEDVSIYFEFMAFLEFLILPE
jgi:hypothetical protein